MLFSYRKQKASDYRNKTLHLLNSPSHMKPHVTIIVNCYNQAHYLERCVRSVLAQTFTDLECIIVDDGSTDHTKAVSHQLAQSDSRVRYVHKENGGLPSARNFGVAQAAGEWIQCLDADDWIHPEKTAFQLAHFGTSNPEHTILYCDYERLIMDAADQVVERQEKIIGPLSGAAFLQRLMLPDFLAGSPHPALQQCMLMHRSVVAHHRFPEHLKALGDRYFALDAIAKGVRFVYTPIVGTFYTKHKTNRTNSWPYMRNYYVLFYETVRTAHPQLFQLGKDGIAYLLRDTLREKDKQNFVRLTKMLPGRVPLWGNRIAPRHPLLLRFVYAVRSVTPGFLLYKKFRGPRSKALFAILSPSRQR